MPHLDDNPRYLCSELVSVLYEDRQGNVHQTTANLEDISAGSAELLLFDNILQPGAAISFCSKDHDSYGVVQSCEQDPVLGWFARIRLDRSSRWSGRKFIPEHFLPLRSAPEPATALPSRRPQVSSVGRTCPRTS
ncbi:MAG TPA: hypothetical protein VIX89_13400 [Bryobacteraceae bacterium]